MRMLMTRKSCAVEMRNAILGNHLNRLISIIDEQSMLRFFVIIDFIDYQFLSIINAYQSAGERTKISNICAYCKMHIRTCWNRLECVGYWDFLTPIDDNRWVLTTFVWLSIGQRLADANRCQLTNKALIVINWLSIIIGFIDCSSPGCREWIASHTAD